MGKIFANNMTNKGLISSLQLLLKQTNIQRQNIESKATKTFKEEKDQVFCSFGVLGMELILFLFLFF